MFRIPSAQKVTRRQKVEKKEKRKKEKDTHVMSTRISQKNLFSFIYRKSYKPLHSFSRIKIERYPSVSDTIHLPAHVYMYIIHQL